MTPSKTKSEKGMTIQQAIEKAIEGGWTPDIPELYEKEYTLIAPDFEYIFLDPSFWVSLGKALGWDKEDEKVKAYGVEKTWLRMMHRLIDHLASGKDIESFFEQL